MQLQDQQQQLEAALSELQRKQKSYDIAVIEEKLNSIIQRYDDLATKKGALQSEIDEKQLYLANVKYVKEQQLLRQYEQQLVHYEETLQKINEQLTSRWILMGSAKNHQKLTQYLLQDKKIQKLSF